jgi:hypothetical protein
MGRLRPFSTLRKALVSWQLTFSEKLPRRRNGGSKQKGELVRFLKQMYHKLGIAMPWRRIV